MGVIMFTDTTVLLKNRSFRRRCFKQTSPNCKPPLLCARPSNCTDTRGQTEMTGKTCQEQARSRSK